MKLVSRIAALLALALVILPPLGFMLKLHGDLSLMKTLMLVGTVLWFVAAPLWMSDKSSA